MFIAISQLTITQIQSFLFLPKAAQTVANLEEIAKVKGLTDSQAKAFGYLPEDARTLENLKEIAKVNGLTNIQESAFWELPIKDQTPSTLKAISTISGLTNNQASVFFFLSRNRGEETTLEHLQKAAQLTDSQALAFFNIPAEEQTLSTLKEITAITDLTHNQVNAFCLLPRKIGEQVTLEHLQKAAQLTDSQALAFFYLPAEEQTLSTLKEITSITPPTTAQVRSFCCLPVREKTLDNLKVIVTTGGANHQIISAFRLSSTVGAGEELGKIYGHLVTQASFNSLLKQNLPNHYSTEYLAPVISKLAVQVSGMHLLPLTIDTLRFGLPETTSESIELMLKIAMPFVKPTLLSFIPLSPVVIYPTLVLGSAILGIISVNPEREVDTSLYDIVSNILQDNSDPVSLGMLAWSSALYMPGVSLPISIAVAVSTVATASYIENMLSENSNPVLGETNNSEILKQDDII